MDCIVDSNLYALVISGNPTIEDLQAAWQMIRLQYADAVKDGEYIAYARLARDAEEVRIRHQQIIIAIVELRKGYCLQFKRELNKLLWMNYKLDVASPEEYDKELDNAYNRSKGIMIDLRLANIALEAAQNRFATSKDEPTRFYFEQMIITLSDQAGYRLTNEITVFEYCDRIRRLNEYHKAMKRK